MRCEIEEGVMLVWSLARKDLRLLLRDPRAVVVLVAMPLIFILVLGVSLGEGFGQKPDDRLRISVVDLDKPFYDEVTKQDIAWSKTVVRDLATTAGIRVEVIPTLEEAEELVKSSQRSAVLVFGPTFSEKVTKSSFLPGGVNPLFRDGVDIEALDARMLVDPTQLTAASIIQQVGQVTMLRVVLPWMIGRAFEKIGAQMGNFVKNALQKMFPSYDLTGTTWQTLTRSAERDELGAAVSVYGADKGTGLIGRGAQRYQTLVPSYTVMFAYFLVLTVGWLFVAERRQGTLKRLRAAPLSRTQILLGKLLPCFALSLAQGVLLLVAGKLIFGMSWGENPWWLLLVVFTTSLSAMGLALLVASVAKSEAQVAIYGTLLVLVLAGISGCLMGDRDLMPENMQKFSLITPQAWALLAYKQLLANPGPANLAIVAQACLALTGFGLVFLFLAWCFLRLDTQT
jgi:ABC-type Na+ efflux pump permease subunit